MWRYFLFALTFTAIHLSAQSSYFPPLTGNTWDTQSPSNLNWPSDSLSALQQYLENQNTKAFIVLVDGKIVVEWYYDNFTQDSLWYWASAGKSLSSFLVGMAVEDNLLQLSDPTSMYLGLGWTNLSPTDENNIQIIHQLSMTTGLDDGVANPDCTDPNCLDYLASPGSRWAYHNAPYTLLHDVLDSALGTTVNNYILNNLTLTTGITGLFLPIGDNEVYFSTPRSMARFGLLALENGIWDGDTILGNMNYIQQMTQPSQSINESYGYLWWLNGQNSHMLPGIQFTFPGYLVPNAPADMFMALGMNDQKIYVVPSSNMVVIRMGNAPSTPVPGPSGFDNELWARLSFLHQQLNTPESIDHPYSIYPSPATNEIRIEGSLEGNYSILDVKGRVWNSGNLKKGAIIDISELPAGQYFFLLENIGAHQKFTKM